ncbi:MAG: Bifunctional protein FolD [Candidatus Amesbacteria bacterium GW2011_GWB1_47_26]|uniref:methenyltetrahydrofolate cyclohydrolase n=1 Tax=Candidatus Amesbacteria bacterium GW2011_GWC2_45_19 TaxID=1618366 RepID=A0A0G1M2X7_9BACT|nr:MAG: Bifunctional protein FolD [Candidatus Amesbacteria bacterium GW2011_GWC2_45_19]KKU37934.1 MAG: Bifunctional protein FolD [Candidatus Amesbacteria bacterium GW2011_GWA1_46_35]KKU69034.1 MAG: Bifunctional protein FolD [Microgenomates group bacterium GW2011_GWC1_47_20]KKU74720.1 MAG: Bifunctional protein FolD [Candidatus Amesbacteria bacterium GW2011_GWB1_47_26]
MIFDGKKFAEEIIAKLPRRKAKLAIFLDPGNVSGAKYVQKKIEVAKRLGVEIVMNKIDGSEDGIMVQLPHPRAKELIANIPPKKDVDGLREDSPYQPAVVRAIVEILNNAPSDPPLNLRGGRKGVILIVGCRGFVGRKLMQVLPNAIGMDKGDFDPSTTLRADVVISTTGQKDLIDSDMVRDGFIAIDVGYPDAEFTPAALAKASFYTPVPGGVGPVTVACLFTNLLVECG